MADKKLTMESKVKDIMQLSGAKEAFDKNWPGFVGNPQYNLGKMMSPKTLKAMSKGQITDAMFKGLEEDLRKLQGFG